MYFEVSQLLDFFNSGMIHLKEVDLSRCSKITDAGVKHLLLIPGLEKLSISETGVTADGAALLASLTNLLVLDLEGLLSRIQLWFLFR